MGCGGHSSLGTSKKMTMAQVSDGPIRVAAPLELPQKAVLVTRGPVWPCALSALYWAQNGLVAAGHLLQTAVFLNLPPFHRE